MPTPRGRVPQEHVGPHLQWVRPLPELLGCGVGLLRRGPPAARRHVWHREGDGLEDLRLHGGIDQADLGEGQRRRLPAHTQDEGRCGVDKCDRRVG